MAVLFIIVVILAPQVWAFAVGFTAARRIGLLFASVLAVLLANAVAQREKFSGTDLSAHHDTYYVVVHFNQFFNQFIAFLGVLPVLALLLWAAARWSGPLPRVTPLLASLLSVSTLMPLLYPFYLNHLLGMPRYSGFAGYGPTLDLLNRFSTLLFMLLYVALTLIALFCLLRRLNTWSKSR